MFGNDPNLQYEQKINLTDIDEPILSDNNLTSCFYCHLLHPEIMPSGNEIATSQPEDEEVHCLTRIRGSSFKHPINIDLPVDLPGLCRCNDVCSIYTFCRCRKITELF